MEMCYHTRSPLSKDSKVFRTHKILTISLMFGVSPGNSRQHIYTHGGKRHYRFFLFAINWTWMCRKWPSRGVLEWRKLERRIICAFYLGLYRPVGAPFLVLRFEIIRSYFRIKRYSLISTLSISAHPHRFQMRFQSSIRVSERCFMKANWIHVNKSLHGQVTIHVGHARIAISVIYSWTFVFHMLPLWLKYLRNSLWDT